MRFFLFTILTFGLTSFSASPSFAKIKKSDCAASDYSDDLGPIRNQGSAGECFALTAADLIGFNQNLAPAHPVSAVDVGLNYMKVNPENLLRAVHEIKDWQTSSRLAREYFPLFEKIRKGSESKPVNERLSDGGIDTLGILAYNLAGGACLEENLPSEESEINLMSNTFMQRRFDQAAGLAVRNSLPVAAPMPVPSEPPSAQVFTQLCNKDITPFKELRPLSDQLNDESVKAVSREFEKKCGPRTLLKTMQVETVDLRTHRSSGAEAALHILTGPPGHPLAIDYDSSFLTESRHYKGPPKLHTSSLVGSRWNSHSKTCEFKLRNSWGKDCSYYQRTFRKSCQENDGYMWVSEKEIDKQVFSITSIVPQK